LPSSPALTPFCSWIGAGWHVTAKLGVPENIMLVPLSSIKILFYCPDSFAGLP
jgi:hypothetical protein